MTDRVHADRRHPRADNEPVDLQAAAVALLDEAGSLRSGRSARTLTPGGGAALKQTLLALRAGERLQEHRSPGPTTLFGIKGTAVLTYGEASVSLTEGVWAPCPQGPHALEAASDAVVLITVVPEPGTDPVS